MNKLLKQISVLLNINRISTTGGNPQANGVVEQHNSTLKDMLAAYVNKHQDDWDTYLSHIAYAYNTTVNSQTGFSPFFMVYGREARQLCNEWIDTYLKTNPDPEQYVLDLAHSLQLGWELAASQKSAEVSEFNKTSREPLPFREYQLGQRFFLRHTPVPTAPADPIQVPSKKDPTKLIWRSQNVTISAALQHRWTGPYKITKKFSPVTYETIINGVTRVVHALHMKPDPIADTLRMHLPLPITQPTPMKSIQEREHISMRLMTPQPLTDTPQVNDQVLAEPTSPTADGDTSHATT